MSNFDSFIKEFVEQELQKRNSVEEFAFHKDAAPLIKENIFKLQKYLIENYKHNQDFRVWINYGEEVMHAFDVYNQKLLEDDYVHELLSLCDLVRED